MQLSVLVLVCCFCLFLEARGQCIDTYEPGCRSPAEIGRPQRHCIDPTKYWMCPQLNGKAVLKKCAPNTGFDQDKDACIPWIAWVWKPCIEPPSRPKDWEHC
ncbi:uncharacterized protein LOC117790351 [Drosophila innubila]|uniref:uncharacterized protein LOC117790351 n=1 Tax=Drosophila innubila TaxID=198719 RepID=UPI00148C11FE|nr:uncharacterized protein LOC117790351 [Drosophila innubila]